MEIAGFMQPANGLGCENRRLESQVSVALCVLAGGDEWRWRCCRARLLGFHGPQLDYGDQDDWRHVAHLVLLVFLDLVICQPQAAGPAYMCGARERVLNGAASLPLGACPPIHLRPEWAPQILLCQSPTRETTACLSAGECPYPGAASAPGCV